MVILDGILVSIMKTKTVILTVLSCAWVVLLVGLGIYTFNTPRAWVASALGVQEPAAAVVGGLQTGVASAPSVANGASSAASTTDTAASSTVDTTAVSTTDTTGTVPMKTVYQYKLLSGVAPCKLNQLGADGWHPVQFGGTLVSTYGGDNDCKKFSITDSLDWVLLQKEVSVPQ